MASVKVDAAHTGEHKISVKLINTAGETTQMGEEIIQRFSPTENNAPSGVGYVVQLNLGVRRLGTCYVCLDLDGSEVARAPITLAVKTPISANQ